jgi:hypothetical protein
MLSSSLLKKRTQAACLSGMFSYLIEDKGDHLRVEKPAVNQVDASGATD